MTRRNGQTDRRTLDSFVDPAPHITRAVSTNCEPRSPRRQGNPPVPDTVDGKQVKISGVSSKEPNGTGRTQKHTRLSSMEAVVNSLGCVCTRNNVVARAQQRRRQAGERAGTWSSGQAGGDDVKRDDRRTQRGGRPDKTRCYRSNAQTPSAGCCCWAAGTALL